MTEAEYVANLEKMSFPQLEAHIDSLFAKLALAQRHRAGREKYGRHSYTSDGGGLSAEQLREALDKRKP